MIVLPPRWPRWVLLCSVGLALLAFGWSALQTPLYEAVSVYVRSPFPCPYIGRFNATTAPLTCAEREYRANVLYCQYVAGRRMLYDGYMQVLTGGSSADVESIPGIVRDPGAAAVEAGQPDVRAFQSTCTVSHPSNQLSLHVLGPTPDLTAQVNAAVGLIGMTRANEVYDQTSVALLTPVTVAPVPDVGRNTLLWGLIGLVTSSALFAGVRVLGQTFRRVFVGPPGA